MRDRKNKLKRFQDWLKLNEIDRLKLCPFCEKPCTPEKIMESNELQILSFDLDRCVWQEFNNALLEANIRLSVIKFLFRRYTLFYEGECEGIDGSVTELSSGNYQILYTSSYLLNSSGTNERIGRPSCEKCNHWSKIDRVLRDIQNLGTYERRQQTIRETQTEVINRMEIYERDKGICHLCGEAVDKNNFHLDHVIPLTWKHGGTHTKENIKITHPKCNMAKHDKTLESYIKGQ